MYLDITKEISCTNLRYLYLQKILNSERMSVVFSFLGTVSIEHSFPSNGAIKEHCMHERDMQVTISIMLNEYVTLRS